MDSQFLDGRRHGAMGDRLRADLEGNSVRAETKKAAVARADPERRPGGGRRASHHQVNGPWARSTHRAGQAGGDDDNHRHRFGGGGRDDLERDAHRGLPRPERRQLPWIRHVGFLHRVRALHEEVQLWRDRVHGHRPVDIEDHSNPVSLAPGPQTQSDTERGAEESNDAGRRARVPEDRHRSEPGRCTTR